jgi:hypothetical protein
MKNLKIFLAILWFSILGSCQNKKENNINYAVNIDSQISHDINLPNWGPYTKKYVGISHIPEIDKGIRFDLSVFPTITNEKSQAPDVLKSGNFHIWEAASNLKYFSYRHQLVWKDKLYSNINYSEIDENSRLISIDLVNNLEEERNITLHLIPSISFPPLEPYKPDNEIKMKQISLPNNAKWVDAVKYNSYTFKTPGHRDRLHYNGMLRGEVRENGLINGNGIEFSNHKGDKVSFEYKSYEKIDSPILYLRYKILGDSNSELKLSGIVDRKITLEKNSDVKIIELDFKEKENFSNIIEFESLSSNRMIIEGFTILDKNQVNYIKVTDVIWNPQPKEIIIPEIKNAIILKYDNIDNYYGIFWGSQNFIINNHPLKDLPENYNSEYEFKYDRGNSEGFFKDIQIKPILLSPKSNLSIQAIVCTGNLEEVKQHLKNANSLNFSEIKSKASAHLFKENILPEGEKYLFSQKRMQATLLSNIVYPIYTQNQYIRHYTPGRKWDCLYTWDSGFIGIGLNEFDSKISIENLNAYLNTPEEQSAFIHHGTPLPVQFYQFLEIWNKNPSKDFLNEVYPKLKYYYDFLSGKIETSTTNNLNSGLIRTWDYFYNSGGWDDYPAQKFVHDNKLTKTTTPSISTAHLIRIAKIMMLASRHLQLKDDFEEYKMDILKYSKALNNYAWDSETGYYSYVVHNKSGIPSNILKTPNGLNFNMGLDGISPIIAGISNEQQIAQMLNNLKTKGKLWSDMGISTIDQTAPYFDEAGYWNGHVWMPHQWFIWKAMLDLGEDEFAHKIAHTALNVWKHETENSYNSREYFSINSQEGKGWYQFSGLSTPVISWYFSYYQIGTFTSGFDTWIIEKDFNDEYSEFNSIIRLLETNNKPFSFLICLNPNYEYEVYWNNKKISHKELYKGFLTINLIRDSEVGKLNIRPKK